jgi:hypothetical protein
VGKKIEEGIISHFPLEVKPKPLLAEGDRTTSSKVERMSATRALESQGTQLHPDFTHSKRWQGWTGKF